MQHRLVRWTPQRIVSVAPAVIFALVACGERSGDPASRTGSWQARVDTLGDTVVVHTRAGSAWSALSLVEELRIGRLDGAEHEMFGTVGALGVTANGDVLIYDGQATALRRFGADGTYRGTIGREGAGPGEYRNVAGLVALDDGRLVLSDFGNRRFNVYGAGGELLDTWGLQPTIAEQRPLYVHADGGVFLHTALIARTPPVIRPVLIRLDASGTPMDTTPVPYTDYERPSLNAETERGTIGTYVPFTAAPAWSVTAAGDLVSMLGDRYALHVRRKDGSVLRIMRDAAPVPVSADERAAEEARVTEIFRPRVNDWRWDGPRIPDTKPPIGWVHTGRDGTLWVRTAQPGTVIPPEERLPRARTFVREPVVFDVFAADGRYLGALPAPEGMLLQPYPVIGRDHVWAVVRDADGVDVVARFRIERKE